MVVDVNELSGMLRTDDWSPISSVTQPFGDGRVGFSTGENVGERVGFLVVAGANMGERVGFLVGERVGFLVGERVGFLVGAGASMGERVGFLVGEKV